MPYSNKIHNLSNYEYALLGYLSNTDLDEVLKMDNELLGVKKLPNNVGIVIFYKDEMQQLEYSCKYYKSF